MKTTAAPSSNDDLIAELNGALSRNLLEPTQIDRPAEQPLPLDKQLEVGGIGAKDAAPRPNQRAQQLDKTLSKAGGGHGYRVIVVGEYYAKSIETKGNVIKRYTLPFNLPSLVNAKGEAALGIIVGKLLKPALHKLDPLAVTFRTHSIESVTPLQGAPEPTSLAYMSFDALKEFVRANMPDFPVDVDEYVNIEHLREDVIDFKVNATSDVVDQQGNHTPGGFGVKKTPSERILERHTARKEEHELLAMNEGLEA